MGIEEESEEDEVRRVGRKLKREKGGDDLDNDFVEEVTMGSLGTGLGSEQPQEQGESHTETSTEEQELRINVEDENGAADKIQSLVLSRKTSNSKPTAKQPGLPFMFPCPKSHHELLSILEDVDEENVVTVIQRIRSLHHPSLSEHNPAKLQVCYKASI